MTNSFKIIKFITSLQCCECLIKHACLFLYIAITIFIIFKSHYNNWFIVISLNFTLIGNFSIIPNFNLQQAMFISSMLIEFCYQVSNLFSVAELPGIIITGESLEL